MDSETPQKERSDRHGFEGSDYTIYPTSDKYKSTQPWIIENYEEKGAFSYEQKRNLSDQFGLDQNLIDRLSLYIGNCLDVDTAASFYSLTKSKAVAKGHTLVRRALRDLEAGKLDDEVRPALNDLSGIFFDGPEGKDAASLIADKMADLKLTLKALMQVPNAIASEVPDDKRATRDSRRILVVEHCCYVWEDAGRKISYTTFPSNAAGDQRGGKLFDLINAVVEMVTLPSQKKKSWRNSPSRC